MSAPELARDKNGVRLQVSGYMNDVQDATEKGVGSFVLDGTSAADTSSTFTYNTVVELTATTAMVWVKVGDGVTAVDQEGQPIPQNGWKTMTVNAGEVLSVIGGKVAVVPVSG